MKIHQRTHIFRLITLVALGLLTVFFFPGPQSTEAAVPAGYSEYYIPGSTNQLFQIFQGIDNDPELGNAFSVGTCTTGECNQMHSVISVALATDNATVYYDHWENGYGTGSSDVDETYTGNAGDVLTFESGDIVVPRASGNTCASTNPNGPSTNCYDGRDRIYVAGGAPTVARASWPEVTETVFALAWEVYPVKPYLTNYTIPVGEDMFADPPASLGYKDFQSVFVTVQSTTDGNTVAIDDPRTGGVEVTTTLARGEVTQLYNIGAGTTISANYPVQVQFVVGQDHNGLRSEARGFTAVPSGIWGSAYYNPVSSLNSTYGTEIYIYNPTGSILNITWEDSTGSGTFDVPANSTRSYTDLSAHNLPVDSALYLAATDGTTEFWAIGSGGTANTTGNANGDYDYGFSLVPANLLKDDYFISWAPGTTDFSNNGSPLWVTPIEDNTTIFVDYSPNNGTVDATYTIDRIEIQKIFDPDNNNTGMHIWATNPIAVVWGEDAVNISSPYIDVGYTSLPLPAEWIDIVLTVEKTANPSVIPNGAGQTSTFTLVVETDNFSIDDVTVVDTLPANWAYVSGSTTITLPDTSTITGAAADPDVAVQDLTWDAFPVNPLDMNSGEALTIEFQGITTGSPPLGYSTNEVVARGTRGTETFEANDIVTVYITDLEINKSADIVGMVKPGDTIEYTVVITNNGSSTQNNVVVADPIPAGTNYVAQSTIATYLATTKDNIPGGINADLVDGTPPNLVLAGDDFDLLPGGVMIVTFQVNVDEAIPLGLISIDNIASVTSVENPVPLTDSVTNPLPLANLGDRVWYDTDGNGLQDGGEPGISGVVVNLFDPGPDGIIGGSDDVLIGTTTTNANGNYAFNDAVADTYFVQFDLPTGYSLTAQDAGGDNTIDSDVNGSGQSDLFALLVATTDTTVDAGLTDSQLDYGDLPDSYNNTILGEDGARHVVGTLRLGPGVDTDPDGQEDGAAAGDTNDDGVNRSGDFWTNGATVDIDIDLQGTTGSGSVEVGIWIDWDNNGVFDLGDFFPFTGLTAGSVNTVQITIPDSSTYTVGTAVNVRVRAFDPASVPGGSLDSGDFVGLATNGEVEDYQWNFGPTAVTLQDIQAATNASLLIASVFGFVMLALVSFRLYNGRYARIKSKR